MSSGYLESPLSAPVADAHRALASLQEELEAIDYYQQRMDRTSDETLKAILAHNRDEEIEHASMLMEWLRRNAPSFDLPLKTYLFTKQPVTEIEEAADAATESPATAGAEGLGIGGLK